MNKEFMLDFADYLETNVPPESFDMGVFATKTDCGTVGCIAGWMAFRDGWFPVEGNVCRVAKDGREEYADKVAMRLADFTDEQADAVFYAEDVETPTDAAAKLRKMVLSK